MTDTQYGSQAAALGMALATILSKNADSRAYVMLFGVSVFAALAVWILILATHTAFRIKRRGLGLPPSPVQLTGAPSTSGVIAVFLVAVLLDLLHRRARPAWQWAPVLRIAGDRLPLLKKTGRCDHLVDPETPIADYTVSAHD